jgi:hypothetical protein
MKLNTIASLFKKNKRLDIYTSECGEQWISNGAALYSLSGMPHLTPETVLRIFDVPPDKHAAWICDEKELPTTIDFSDVTESETIIEPIKLNIEWDEYRYRLFPDGERIYTIRADYIKPLLDEPDYLTYQKRETSGGGFVLAVKIGMELKAIIFPYFLHESEEYLEEIERMAGLYRSMAQDDVFEAMREAYKIAADVIAEALPVSLDAIAESEQTEL